jgi:predicted transposase YdaD
LLRRCAASRLWSTCVDVRAPLPWRVADNAPQTFAFALIDLIPTQKDKAMEDHSSLMASLDAAVSDYQS